MRTNWPKYFQEHGARCMVPGAWWRCMSHGARCMVMVRGALCMQHGAWCSVHVVWCILCGALSVAAKCMVHGAWCLVHGAWRIAHGAWYIFWHWRSDEMQRGLYEHLPLNFQWFYAEIGASGSRSISYRFRSIVRAWCMLHRAKCMVHSLRKT